MSDTTDALRRFAAENPLVAADVGAILALAEIDQLRHELRLAGQAREAVRAEAAELGRLLEVARAEAGRLRPLAALVSGVLCDARDIPVADTDDVAGLVAGLRQLLAERDAAHAETFRLREALCDVIGLVSRAVAATTEPAGVVVTEDDGDPA